MTIGDQSLLRLKKLLSQQSGTPVERITLDTRLAEDLGMTGLDASEFMDKYFAEFRVDPSGFTFGPYFHDEGGYGIVGLFLFVINRGKTGKPPMTVRQLLAGIQSGRWTDVIGPVQVQ